MIQQAANIFSGVISWRSEECFEGGIANDIRQAKSGESGKMPFLYGGGLKISSGHPPYKTSYKETSNV
jgi:hypothetical protein